MSWAKTFGLAAFGLIPKYNNLLFRICRHYVDRYHGENNTDPLSNGEARLLRERLLNAAVVFDVGANVGDWTILALEANARVAIHCFEPTATTFAQLGARGLPGTVILNHAALDAEAGDRILYLFRGAYSMNSFFAFDGLKNTWGEGRQEQVEKVSCTTLDKYCEEHAIDRIDFLKIDVEGAELRVLQGARRMLTQGAIKFIQFEHGLAALTSRVFLKDFFELLTPLGYRMFKVFPDGLREMPDYDRSIESFQYSNYAAWLLPGFV